MTARSVPVALGALLGCTRSSAPAPSAGLDVDAILCRANLPRPRFSVAKQQGTTAEFFALWHAVEQDGGGDPALGIRSRIAPKVSGS
jgi:hypothetical protein